MKRFDYIAALLIALLGCPSNDDGGDDLSERADAGMGAPGAGDDAPPRGGREAGDDTPQGGGTGSTGSPGTCGADGCTVQLRRGGTAPHAGRLDFDALTYVCGSGMGLEVECGDVTRPMGKMVTIKAYVVKGTAAVLAGFRGDCEARADAPNEAVMLVDGPVTCEAVFDCAEGLELWHMGSWMNINDWPRCDTARRREECRGLPYNAELPSQWASTNFDDPVVPPAIDAWWDTDRHCLFECPEDLAAVKAEISALNSQPDVTTIWDAFANAHGLCCQTCP